MRNDDITYVFERKLGVINNYQTGWNKELNVIAWNGNASKYDIRDWSPDHYKMTKGVTLHETEARKLYELLRAEFENEV